MKTTNNWQIVENTMYGFKKAVIYQNSITKRYKIVFSTLKDVVLFTSYYKNIPSHIIGSTF